MGLFAIGDIHGRLDLLRLALAEIERRSQVAKVIFLGDYIDRGPDSKGVLETLMQGPTRTGDRWVCLRGNHESMMVQTYRAPLNPAWWLRNGGTATLQSFGGEVPENVLAWCESLPLSVEVGNCLFVHAGVNPSKPLSQQDEADMLWIRDKFLISDKDFGKHIVHGHTPHEDIELEPNRTNLDTGAFATGRLSIGIFGDSGPIGTFQVA